VTEPLSANNPRVKRLARLTRDRKARRDECAFVVEGPRAINTFLACRNAARVEAIFVDDVERLDDSFDIGVGVRVHVVDRGLLDRIGNAETPQGMVAVAEMTNLGLVALEGTKLGVIVDGVQDPGNVGAIVRVAAAMGAECVICVSGCADPFSPKAVRASAGTIGAVAIVSDVEDSAVIEAAAEHGFTLIGATMSGGVGLDAINVDGPVGLVLGSEGAGLSQTLVAALGQRVTIDMASPVESLNVAVTAGILLHGLRPMVEKH